MIHSSSYWKDELLTLANKLERRRKQRRFSARSFAKFEKEIFFAFYAIRKLLEAKKLTQRVGKRSISVESYSSTGKGVTWLNRDTLGFEIEKYFDVTKRTHEKVSIGYLCNQIIHSYIFIPEFYGDRLMRILISSDYMRNQKLYSVKIRDVERLLRRIAFDDVRRSRAIYSRQIGDYVVTND